MTTISLSDFHRDLLAAYGTDYLSEIEQMLMFWRHEATKDLALEMADRNRERARQRPERTDKRRAGDAWL